MKAFLMHKDQDVDPQRELPPNEQALTQDLELTTLFDAMARGDSFLFDVARKAVLSSLTDPEAIIYRQHILRDCLKNPSMVREMYAIVVEAIERERKEYFGLGSKYPDAILHRSLDVLQMFVGMLKKLKTLATEQSATCESEGLTAFFAMLTKELDDDYFASVQQHLRDLKFRDGVLISAALGQGNKGTNYILRQPKAKQSWLKRITVTNRSAYSFAIADRDESGARALSELQDRGINLVANALAQSTDHILSFFRMLRFELGFYVGCLNVQERLAQKGEPLCFPVPVAMGQSALSFHGLYDIGLALSVEERVAGNDVNAHHTSLVMITGANRGGKSTFLRGLGVAQLMMQCGLFAPAASFSATICDGLFTHYKREEDSTMGSGKLDEELSRMSEIVDHITPHSMVLCNESFAATNEREGSEIARQIIRALVETGVRVFFVTHLFDLAQGLYLQKMDTALFLRAERQTDGRRTFRLVEGEPLPTSYGKDVYQRIFGTVDKAVAAAPPSAETPQNQVVVGHA